MQTKLLGCLAAMAAAIVMATPATAFRGGGGGFHGGFGGGGMHFGAGGFGGPHFGSAVSVAAWSPAGACSSPVETALSVHRSPAGIFSSTDSTTSRSGTGSTTSLSGTPSSSDITIFATLPSLVLAYRSLTATPRTGTVAGAGMAGSGLTSAMTTVMAISTYF
jgi:hypothetical protein